MPNISEDHFLIDKAFERIIEHPPFSPDLNPIENLFAQLVKKVKHPTFYKNSNEFWNAIYTTWNELNDDSKTLQNLMLSMRRRYDAVIKSNGEYSKY